LSLALLWSGTSFAAIDKCHKRIQGEGAKLQKFIYSAVQKCADAIRKEKAAGVVKGGTDCSSGKACLVNAAIFCEKQLAAVYDAANRKPYKSKIELFRATLEKSSATDECTDDDLRILQGMGHQLSGTVNLATAPPVSGPCDFNGDGIADTNCRLTFLIDWLTYAIEDATIRQLQAQNPDLFALLKEAIDATSANPSKPQTNCTDQTNRGYRPNLCKFGPQCLATSCNLSASSQAVLQAPGLVPFPPGLPPIPLTGSVPLQICRPGPGGVAPSTQRGLGAEFHAQNDVLYLLGGAGNSVQAPPPYPGLLGTLVQGICVTIVGQQGWCDCGNLGVKKDATTCQDRVGASDLSAGGPSGQPTDECGVASNKWVADKAFKSNSHASTLTISPGGSSTTGDCVNLVSLQFTLVPNDPSPPDPSPSPKGADGIVCTADDLASPLPTFTIPVTTGTVTAQLKDAIVYGGTCTAGTNPPCLQNVDCAPSNGTCNTSTLDVRDFTISVSGSAGTCGEYLSGDLSNLKFVTGAALADLVLGALPGSVDGWLTIELDCQ
jgi:hypothetical protein